MNVLEKIRKKVNRAFLLKLVGYTFSLNCREMNEGIKVVNSSPQSPFHFHVIPFYSSEHNLS